MFRPALFFLGVMLAALPARADVTVGEARDAVAIYDEGKRLQEKGDFEGAYLLYREADAMYPGALPKYRIAVCLDALDRTKEAITAYRAFLELAEPKHQDLISVVRSRLKALEPPKKRVRVASDVARARVRVAEAHRPVKDPATDTAKDTAKIEQDPLPMRVTGFVLLGATLGAGAAFAATYAQSRTAAREPDRQRYGIAAGILAPTTAALALGAVIVLPLSFRSDDSDDDAEEKEAFVTPYAGPTGAGFVGRF